MNGEYVRILMELVMAFLKILSEHPPVDTEETRKISQSG
jgi:hypothetical protein